GGRRPERSTQGTAGSGGWTARSIVASVPSGASEKPHRRRFLYRRNDLAPAIVRVVLHRSRQVGGGTSPGARPIPTRNGSRSKHGRWPGPSASARNRFAG